MPDAMRGAELHSESERSSLGADGLVSDRAIEDGTMLRQLLEEVGRHRPDADIPLIERAYDTARRAHSEQRRKSGEPYLVHPVRVAQTIAKLGLDTCSLVAGLLHDAVEDSELSVYELTEQYGREVATIVDGVTKLGKVPYLSRREQQAESFRKMLIAMSSDIRVLLVKLCDRLDNMRTLEHMSADKQERISRETMEIYAPLAHRLGLDWIRRELQDLSFRYLEPATYDTVSRHMNRLVAESPGFIERCVDGLRNVFEHPSCLTGDGGPDGAIVWDPNLVGNVDVRATVRSPYQVHRMAEETGRKVEQASDLVTFQVVTRDRPTCYLALGLLHGHFKPIPGRFRDYIALPRPNHYRALHTAVIDREGVRMEVQLRSRWMDDVACRGVAAQSTTAKMTELRGLAWLGQLMDWQGEVRDPSEFLEAVKADLFADEVYVFTPQGDIHTFPKGATPIDFAFAIHTDVGMHCSGARVNGQVVPLRYRLRQGDTVEIITNPEYGPRAEWLKMCITARARAKIKHYLRAQERTRLRTIGRSLLEQEMSSRGLRLDEYESRGIVAEQAEVLGLGKDGRSSDAVYEAVGGGQVSAWDVAQGLAPGSDGEGEDNLFARVLRRVAGRMPKSERRSTPSMGRPGAPILVTQERVQGMGEESVIELAPCCSPLPGDPLVGFFRAGKGIAAHVQGCPEALEQLSGQRVHLAWGEHLKLDRPVTLEIRTENAVGLLAEMSRAFSQNGVNIKQANCRAYDDGDRAINTFQATVRDLAHLEALVKTLKNIPGVIGVERVFTRAV